MTTRPAQVHPSALSPTEWDAWSGVVDAFGAEGPAEWEGDDGVRKLWSWAEGQLESRVDAGRAREIFAFFRNLPPSATPLCTLLAILRLASHSVNNSRLTRDHLFLQHPEPVLLKPPSSAAFPASTPVKLANNPFRQQAFSAESSSKTWVSAGGAATTTGPLTPVSHASPNPFRQSFSTRQQPLPVSPPLSVAPSQAEAVLAAATRVAAPEDVASPPLPPRPVFAAAKPRPEQGGPTAPPPLPRRRSASLRRHLSKKDETAPSSAPEVDRSLAPSPSSALPVALGAPSPASSPVRPRPPTPQHKPGSLTSSSHLGLDMNASLRPPPSGRTSASSATSEGRLGGGSTGRRSRGNSSASATASSWTLELAAPSSPSTKKQPSPLPPLLSQQSSAPPPISTSPSISHFKAFSSGSVELPPPPSATSSTTITPGHTGGTATSQRSKTVGARPPPPPKRRPSAQISPLIPTSSPFTDHPSSFSPCVSLHLRAPSLPHTLPPRHHRAPSSTSTSIAALGESLVSKAKDEVARRTSSLRSPPAATYGPEASTRVRTRMEEELERERERREEGVGLIGAAAAEEALSERDDAELSLDPFSGAPLRRRGTDSSTSTSGSDLDGAGGGDGGLEGFEEDDDEESRAVVREERSRRRERRKEVEREARRKEEEGQWTRLS